MTSLIRSITLKNFKGFSEEIRIDIKPITLLFGANSAGKSSVLQALQYVREILERNNANADRTLQGGDAVDLGGFLNLVNGRDAKSQIEIEIGMELGSDSIPELVPEAFEDWQTSDDDVWTFYESMQQVRRKVERLSVRLVIGWHEQREMPVVIGYEVATNDVWCVKIESSLYGRDTSMRLNHQNPIFLSEVSEEEQEISEDLLAELSGWVSEQDLGDADSIDSKKAPTYSILPELLMAVRGVGMERPGDGLRSWLSDFNGALPKLDKVLSIPVFGANGASDIYIAREFTAFLSWLTIGPAMLLRDQLRQLRYIGPLRRIPPRGFAVSLTKSEAAWSDGMAAWESLMTGHQGLVDLCSAWMSDADKLNTGYKLERQQTQEMDLNSLVPQPIGQPRTRIRLIDSAGLAHQPQDVGVGISQVLPVVVAAQDGNGSVVCIEQPELHVHPSVQVGLGDLLIEGAAQNGLSFLIETHSEHLILRILRRIRETADGSIAPHLTKIGPHSVGVVYLNKIDGKVCVTPIPINEEGDFDTPWPTGFFEERGPELF
ncbi:AAA family ATPase [Undibacterium sp.]|uniref:AAA family ATPase n=1 Tax=Undibacterium sp. TaxID=1914977 RepID=UPI0025D4E37C|nr:AAA family ATPase [Undibacterium sp.]